MRLNVNIKIFQHFINLVYNITYHNPELHPTISIVLDENFSKDTRYNLYKNAVAVVIFPSSDDAYRSSSFHSCKSILKSM